MHITNIFLTFQMSISSSDMNVDVLVVDLNILGSYTKMLKLSLRYSSVVRHILTLMV